MRKQLLFAFMVAAIASCSKNEVGEINSQDPNIVKFSTYVGAATKTGITTTANIADAGVYALSANKSTLAEPFMNNVEIAKATNWQTAVPYYWPSTGTVDFFAYSPYAESATIDANGVLTDDSFAIAATAAAQVDILAADAMEDLAKAGGSVDINFDHMLSKVAFKVIVKSSKDYSIEVNADNFAVVGVDGIHEGIDIDASPRAMVNTETTTANVYTYADAATAPSFATGVIDAVEGGKAVDNAIEGAFMLLPQSLTEWNVIDAEGNTAPEAVGAAFRMDYDLQLNGEYIVADGTTKQTAYFPIPTDVDWEAGKSYLYTLTLDAANLGTGGYEPDPKPDPTDPEKPDPDDPKDPVIEGNKIMFTVTVTPWDADTDVTLPNPGASEHHFE